MKHMWTMCVRIRKILSILITIYLVYPGMGMTREKQPENPLLFIDKNKQKNGPGEG